MYSTIIDNANTALVVSQGDTLGNRQDAVAKFDFEGLNLDMIEAEELELAA